ncbi:MAG TPA: PAS domain S-box protein, partial [Steroidobacteraceae bacterium]|nr:PAS domain S-box protein [Steroidobacteraceae bacterium]
MVGPGRPASFAFALVVAMSDEITLGNIGSLDSPITDLIARAAGPLIEGDDFFRELVNALPAAVYTTDPSGRITYYNEAAAALWGCRPDLGNSDWCGSWKLFWPDGRVMPHDQCPMATAVKKQQAIRGLEAVAERPDGTRVPFLPFPTPIFNASGVFVGAVNMLVDISERKRAEEAMQRLACIVDSSDDAIISKDLDGIISSWNNAASRLFGYEAAEVIGKPVTILIPQDRRDEELFILQQIRRGERIDHYETVRRRKDGGLIDVSLTVSPVRNAQGKIIGASKIARDITKRKREVDAALLLASIVETSDDAIISKNLDGIITSWNKGAERIFGYMAEEIIGKSVKVLIPREYHAEEDTILERIRRGQRIEHYETIRQRKHGSLINVSLTISPVADPQGKIFGASKIARDITERARTEAQISLLAREAEHRTKNILATVQATVHLTQSETIDGLKSAIEGRIQALANVHALFVQSRWEGANLRNLVTQELSPYCQDVEARARIEGPDLLLEPYAAQTIAITLHELATNAAKYGALSVPDGRVHVAWSGVDK